MPAAQLTEARPKPRGAAAAAAAGTEGADGDTTDTVGGEEGEEGEEEEEEEVLSSFVANAVMVGDPCAWHVDADPSTFPPSSPWVHNYGYYFNR